MKQYFTTKVGVLRFIGLFEGLSLLVLLFVAMPMKYMAGEPAMVRIVGSAHGGLFLAFIAFTMFVASENDWKFTRTTWKVLLASVVPFGTFYVDKKILAPMQEQGEVKIQK